MYSEHVHACRCTVHVTHLSLDLLSAVGVLERVVGVLKAEPRGTDVCDHDCATVAPEGIFEEPSQLAVAVRDVLHWLGLYGGGGGEGHAWLTCTCSMHVHFTCIFFTCV